jgi:preprotein translocase subunit SecY
MILMWLGELITEYGIGNGTSIIITVGILSILPSLFTRDFSFLSKDFQLIIQNGNFNVLFNQNFLLLYAIIIATYLLVWAIIYITEASRKVPVNYASRFRNTKSALSNYLPLKINQAGVMPVIFGSALLTFPQILSQLLLGLAQAGTVLYNFGTFINNSFLVASSRTGALDQIIYYELTYFVLIIGFNFFYTLVAFKPSETADNLKKSGGFIPGIRPGKETEKYITTVILKLALLGGLFLGTVALIPSLVRLTPQGANLTILSGIGGTSILIVVGVISDTIRQMKSLTVTRSYEQFK